MNLPFRKGQRSQWLMYWCLLPGLLVVAVVGLALRVAPLAAQPDVQFERTGIVDCEELVECSGVAPCSWNPGLIWAHNDSGSTAELYLLSTTGALKAIVKIDTTHCVDWEDICRMEVNGKSYLAIGDFGDNNRRREVCWLLLVQEPEVEIRDQIIVRQTVRPDLELVYSYEDRPHDCEACAFDAEGQQLILLTKNSLRLDLDTERFAAGFYGIDPKEPLARLDPQVRQEPVGKLTAKRLAAAPNDLFTAMDLSSDGSRLAFRSYFFLYLLERREDESWADALGRGGFSRFRLPMQKQGESLCFTGDGTGMWSISEGGRQPVFRIEVPVGGAQIERGPAGNGP